MFVFVLDIVNFAEFVPNFRLNLKNLCNVFLAIIISEGGKNCVFFSPPQGKVEILAEKLLCTLLQWGVNDFSSRILISKLAVCLSGKRSFLETQIGMMNLKSLTKKYVDTLGQICFILVFFSWYFYVLFWCNFLTLFFEVREPSQIMFAFRGG